MWKNLLPQGSRTVEILSGVGLSFIGILNILGLAPISGLANLDHLLTWGFLIFLLGNIQLYTIYNLQTQEILRTLASWLSGCLWTWIGLASLVDLNSANIAAILLGIGNLYGFILNFNVVTTAWTD